MIKNSKLKVAHLNVRSLLGKFPDFKDIIINNQYDIVAVSETWLLNVPNEAISIHGYNIIRKDRDGRGGGVALYIKNTLPFHRIKATEEIEQVCICVKFHHSTFIFGTLYRPPNLDHNFFLDKLEDLVHICMAITDNICFLGDTNIDLLKPDNLSTVSYNNLLDTFELTQMVSFPTRITNTSSTLIDHIITSKSKLISNVNVISADISDHELIECSICIKNRKVAQFFHSYRDFRNFNEEYFLADLYQANLENIFYITNIDEKVDILSSTILNIFDKHAPIRTARISKPPAPWLTNNTKYLMKLRDKAKLKFKRTKAQSDWDYYKDLRNFTSLVVKNEKKAHLIQKFENCNSKQMWRELKVLNINNKQNKIIPPELSNVNHINNYYQTCIPNINNNNQETFNFYKNNKKCNFTETYKFKLTDNSTVANFLQEITSTATGNDKLNITLINLCCPYIVKFITNIINCCILEAYFPLSWKQAVIIPIPKIEEPTEFKHLRPISILPIFSKIFEKIINQQLRDHINDYNILPENQSGFRPAHSCTTAILKITDDIHDAADKGMLTALVLLDYSKAFDTLNHELLLAILNFIGLDTKAINLIKSYLQMRTQKVTLNNSTSDPLPLSVGVPQGSILGPLLFTIYTSNFINHLKYSKIHMYADDTQIYYSFLPSEHQEALTKINHDLQIISDISCQHHLIINPTKSSFIIFGSKPSCSRIENDFNLQINNTNIPLVNSIRNLGIIMDNTFRYRIHVSNCLKNAYYKLKLLFPHRSYLPRNIKTLLCESLVLSNFNFCCQVYAPSLDTEYQNKIQKVQNSCIRFIFGILKHEHVSHKLKDLHWLNMKNRFKLHAICLYNKIVRTKLPSYLFNKLLFRTDVHNINTRNKDILTAPIHRTSQFERSFSYNIYKMYNDIPIQMKALSDKLFKTKIKESLFAQQ